MNPLVDGVSDVRGLSQSASAPVPGSGVFMRKGGDNGRPKSMGPEGKLHLREWTRFNSISECGDQVSVFTSISEGVGGVYFLFLCYN